MLTSSAVHILELMNVSGLSYLFFLCLVRFAGMIQGGPVLSYDLGNIIVAIRAGALMYRYATFTLKIKKVIIGNKTHNFNLEINTYMFPFNFHSSNRGIPAQWAAPTPLKVPSNKEELKTHTIHDSTDKYCLLSTHLQAAACFRSHSLQALQVKLTSQSITLPVPFETIEVEFEMASGDIIWWPACVTSINTNASDENSLAAAELTYDSGTDNNNHFYEVEHGSVIRISQTSLRATSKSNTFNKNAILRWRFQEAAAVSTEQDEITAPVPTQVTTSAAAQKNVEGEIMKDTRGALHRMIIQLQNKQDADNQIMLNLFGQLQRQVCALQTAAANTFQTQTMNEQSRQVSSIKQFISYQLIALLKRPLSKRMGQCDSQFSSVIRRYPLAISMPCTFESFTHIALDITRTVDDKHTLYLPTLAAACGALGSNKQVHVAFEKLDSFLLWLGVSDDMEVVACQQKIQRRKEGTIVRVLGGGQWDKVNRSTPLTLFIGQTCAKAAAQDNERLQSEQVKVVCIGESIWDSQNDMFAETFTQAVGCTCFNSMTEDTIHDYDSIHMTWTPLHGRRPQSTYPTAVLLGALTVTLPTLLIIGETLWTTIESTYSK